MFWSTLTLNALPIKRVLPKSSQSKQPGNSIQTFVLIGSDITCARFKLNASTQKSFQLKQLQKFYLNFCFDRQRRHPTSFTLIASAQKSSQSKQQWNLNGKIDEIDNKSWNKIQKSQSEKWKIGRSEIRYVNIQMVQPKLIFNNLQYKLIFDQKLFISSFFDFPRNLNAATQSAINQSNSCHKLME